MCTGVSIPYAQPLCNVHTHTHLCLLAYLHSTRIQPFPHQGLVLWKGWGHGFRMIQAHHIYYALHIYYYISSTSDQLSLDARGWGSPALCYLPLLLKKKHNSSPDIPVSLSTPHIKKDSFSPGVSIATFRLDAPRKHLNILDARSLCEFPSQGAGILLKPSGCFYLG